MEASRVEILGDELKVAMASDDKDKALEIGLELLLGFLTNIAILARRAAK